MRKIDIRNIQEEASALTYTNTAIAAHQVAVYVMCGGGFLGRFAAHQPADFYIDSRVARLPYGRRAIEQAVAVLAELAKKAGLNPHALPEVASFHNCGIF